MPNRTEQMRDCLGMGVLVCTLLNIKMLSAYFVQGRDAWI
jgi:hypothetical protein